MKIYLLKTPEYEANDFKAVADLLQSFEGPMKFFCPKFEFNRKDFYFLHYDLFPKHPFGYESNEKVVPFDPQRSYPLSWRELFTLCSTYREQFSIDKDSFVVLLTKRKNALNWFGAFDKTRNVFVHTAEWDIFTQQSKPKYPIAYEVVANILQALMDLQIEKSPNPYIHEPAIGCMNDFCYNKTQVILKLQTANICPNCIKRIKEKEIASDILKQVKFIFNGIRNEYIFRMEDQPTEPMPLVVRANGKLLLPEKNLEIRLTPLFKTLYIFYLKHPEGVKLNELCDHRTELFELYQRLSVSDSPKQMQDRIKSLTNPIGSSFSQKKSKINHTLTDLLGETMAKYYRIEGAPSEAFKIALPRELVKMEF